MKHNLSMKYTYLFALLVGGVSFFISNTVYANEYIVGTSVTTASQSSGADVCGNPIPSISVLSPVGGEVFDKSQPILVTWKTENISTDADIKIELNNSEGSSFGDHLMVKNTGSAYFSIAPYINIGQYKFTLYFSDYHKYSCYPNMISDKTFVRNSSNLFTTFASTSTNSATPATSVVTGTSTVAIPQTSLATSPSYLSQRLINGSRGDEVVNLQNILLVQKHYMGKVDGIFGPKTQAAVISFQAQYGLEADGIVGIKTRAKLNEFFP